ncbi:MAG TPA: ATPase domain-containing protein [Thermoplasmata archaeon]|nr:ATPase domain-containing protein [Thermoplasmata archaeon]
MADSASATRRVTASRASAAKPTLAARPSRSTTVPTSEDLDLVKDDALLQLRIGRSAHYYAVFVAIALVLDASVVLFVQPTISGIVPSRIRNLSFLIFPLFAGLFLAVFGLRVKWEVYQLWPWEPHFSVTVAAVVLDLALVGIFVSAVAQYGPAANWNLLPGYFPLALLGVAAPLFGLIFTWPAWSTWKVISVGSAALPVGLALSAFFPAGDTASALALTLSSSAVLFLVAGSFVHIISSGTRTHEREIITSGQSRLFQIADELREREEALHFRESAVLEREANVENSELGLGRKLDSLEESRHHISALEADVQARSQSVVQQQRELALKGAETSALSRTLEDRATSLSLRETDLSARLPKLAEREQQVSAREGEAARLDAELSQRDADLKRRTESLPALEAQLEARRQEIESKTTEVLHKEGELRGRAAGFASDDARATDLADRETKLAQLKLVLDDQNLSLGRRAKEARESLAQAQALAQENARRAEEAAVRERGLAEKERDAAEKVALAAQRASLYDEALHAFEERNRALETREAELKNKNADLARAAQALVERDRVARQENERFQAQRTELEQREKAVLVRTKTLDARESEVSLKGLAIDRKAVLPGPAKGAPTASTVAVDGNLLAPATRAKFPDRLPSGTPRLDDLLLGGIPPKAHVALIGDAFVGKEVAIYAFLAEGLRRGEHVVVVTASRSPEELGQKVGLVLPQLHEYEQLGKVHWVDASTPTDAPTSQPSTAVRSSTRGPTDHAGILSALVQQSNAIAAGGAKSFRVAYLGLSASLSASDEKGRLNFLQNLVGILKPRNALALYSLESGSLPESQVETILSRMDGAIRFKQERDKTFLSVLGLGEVETHDWVEYRATPRGLVVGSFALERIR